MIPDVVVPTKITLESESAVGEKVVMSVIISRSIVIVDRGDGVVVGYDEVVVNLPRGGNDARGTIPDCGDVRNAVPAVPGPMVAALPTCVQEKIVGDVVAAPKAIVKVQRGSWAVEEDVLLDHRPGGDCLAGQQRDATVRVDVR